MIVPCRVGMPAKYRGMRVISAKCTIPLTSPYFEHNTFIIILICVNYSVNYCFKLSWKYKLTWFLQYTIKLLFIQTHVWRKIKCWHRDTSYFLYEFKVSSEINSHGRTLFSFWLNIRWGTDKLRGLNFKIQWNISFWFFSFCKFAN